MTKIGLIGGGYWGKNYVRTIEKIKGLELSWIYNKHNEPSYAIPKDSKFTKNYQDILEDNETKAVIISTPERTHYKIAKEALEAGKDVLVEKSMTCSSKDALELIEISKKNSRILMVGHIFLYNPGIIELKKRIQNEELGDLFYFYSRRSAMGPVKQDINVLWYLAPHDISVINYLTGKLPRTVSAKGACFLNRGIEDVVDFVLNYENNVRGFVHVSWTEPKKIRETSVIGSKKMAVFDDMTKDKLKVFDSSNPENFYSPKLENISPLEKQCIQFLESIRTGKQPLTNGQNGYEVVRILECAQKSLETGREIRIKF